MRIDNKKIRHDLLLLGLIPAVMVGILLTALWTNARLEELHTNLYAKGQSYAQFVSPSMEYGIVSGDHDALQRLAEAAALDRDIMGIRVTNREGRILCAYERRPGEGDRPASLPERLADRFLDEKIVRFHELVLRTGPDPGNPAQASPRDGRDVVGFVTLYLTTKHIRAHQAAVALQGIAIVLAILSITSIMAYYTSRTFSRPLEDLADTVRLLGEGRLRARAQTGATGEIGVLERGINDMATALQESHERMETAVHNATAELQTQIALLDAKNLELEAERMKADEASRSKSRLVAWVSHEVRTPLNSITGIADLLIGMTPPTDARHARLSLMRHSAQDLRQIVNDILDLSHHESGSLHIDPVDFDLHSLVRQSCGSLAYTGQEEIRVEIAPDVPQYVHADPLRFKQVLNNLIGNALKFTLDGTVLVQATADGPDRFRLRIEDHGKGLDEDALGRIFDPYVQVDENAERRALGTGLGLTITRALVEAMEGQIEVISTPGRGTAFTVVLPVARATSSPAPNAEIEAPADAKPLAGRHCLLADDDESNRLLGGWQIERLGGEATLVDDGDKAVKACTTGRFDLIVLDIRMPRMDGISAMEAIRALPIRQGPIVAATSDHERELLAGYLHSGFDAAVSKPLSGATLLRLLAALDAGARVAIIDDWQSASVGGPAVYAREAAIERAGGSESLASDLLTALARDAVLALPIFGGDVGEPGMQRELAHKLRGGARVCAADDLEAACTAFWKDSCERTRRRLVDALERLLTTAGRGK